MTGKWARAAFLRGIRTSAGEANDSGVNLNTLGWSSISFVSWGEETKENENQPGLNQN